MLQFTIRMKPLDFYVLLGLLAIPPGVDWTQAELATRLHVDPSSLTRSLQRLERASLWDKKRRRVDSAGAEGLLVHGVRFLLPVELGPPSRGVPTAHSAPPLSDQILSNVAYVWPDDRGSSTGLTVTPIHPTAPQAATENPDLHVLLALVDALRLGRVRERTIAINELHARLARR